jgi:transcriptional regulator GlxA family with amidase domain
MKELDRLNILNKIIDKRLEQVEVANLLGIRSRQVRRLFKLNRQEGPTGLVSKKRDRLTVIIVYQMS